MSMSNIYIARSCVFIYSEKCVTKQCYKVQWCRKALAYKSCSAHVRKHVYSDNSSESVFRENLKIWCKTSIPHNCESYCNHNICQNNHNHK